MGISQNKPKTVVQSAQPNYSLFLYLSLSKYFQESGRKIFVDHIRRVRTFALGFLLNCYMISALLIIPHRLLALTLEEDFKSHDENTACAMKSFRALQKNWPDFILNAEELRVSLEFDCAEAAKISSIREPSASAHPKIESLRDLTINFSNGFVRKSLLILKPYCQKDHPVYGSFCMALDIDAAAELSLDRKLLQLIPLSVTEIGREISKNASVDFYQILNKKLPKEMKGRQISAAIIAGFLGLDNNALQADRLKANLLFENRLDDYAKVFPYLTQYTNFPAIEPGGRSPSSDFLAILFSTRSGKARLTGLKAGQRETYKAYAGFYLGCRLAQAYKRERLISNEAYLVGFSYEMTKLNDLLNDLLSHPPISHPLREIFRHSLQMRQKAASTGHMMQKGARLGYQACSRNSSNHQAI